MKILIVGGRKEADYVIRSFAKDHNKIVVINGDSSEAKLLAEQNGVDVILSEPTKLFSLEIADVLNFDLVIALLDRDDDNFVVCQMAKKIFHIRKAICTVQNPDNVALFTQLGIDSPISASYLLTERIRGESDVESLIKTLSLENDKIVITEIHIKDGFACVGMNLKDWGLPKYCNITAIFRDPQVIIPSGETIINAGDTLVIASAPKDQDEIVRLVKKLK